MNSNLYTQIEATPLDYQKFIDLKIPKEKSENFSLFILLIIGFLGVAYQTMPGAFDFIPFFGNDPASPVYEQESIIPIPNDAVYDSGSLSATEDDYRKNAMYR